MAREPFKQFAARVVNNGELKELLEAVVEAGIPADQIRDTATELMRRPRHCPTCARERGIPIPHPDSCSH